MYRIDLYVSQRTQDSWNTDRNHIEWNGFAPRLRSSGHGVIQVEGCLMKVDEMNVSVLITIDLDWEMLFPY